MRQNIKSISGNILHNFRSIPRHFTEIKRIVLFIPAIILSSSTIILPTSALSYQSSELVSFTFNPTVNITISDDLTIPSLSPGDGKDSNIITVTASSNAMSGYTLSSTVGDSTTYPTNELRKDGTNTTYKFSSITTNTPTLSDFSDNEWGYSYSTDSGTTWQSGDITGTPASGYNGLPLYTTETPITLINSNDASTNSVQFKIGARAASTQVAGEYTNVVNFIGLASPNPVTFDDLFSAAGKTKYNGYYTMQDMNSTICSNAEIGYITQLIDIRDGEVYTVSKLKDERCWLLDNLRLDPTNSITAANMNEDNTNAPAAAITNYLNGSQTAPETGWSTAKVANVDTNFDSYSEPQINNQYTYTTTTSYGRGSGLTGIYYNFCAATVGMYCNSFAADASYDVCPTNWRMPSGGTEGEYQNLCSILYGDTCASPAPMIAADTSSLQYNLSTPMSGYYSDNQVYAQNSYGRFWSSTRLNGDGPYGLAVYSHNIYQRQHSYNRKLGLSLRCVADN